MHRSARLIVIFILITVSVSPKLEDKRHKRFKEFVILGIYHSIHLRLFQLSCTFVNMIAQSKLSDTGGKVMEENTVLRAQIAKLERKLQALTYLPQVIAQKEYDLRQCQEKAVNYEASNLRLNRQLADVIRSSISSKSTPAILQCPKCGYKETSQSIPTVVPGSQPSENGWTTIRLSGRSYSPSKIVDSKLSTDSDISVSKGPQKSKLHVDGAPMSKPHLPVQHTTIDPKASIASSIRHIKQSRSAPDMADAKSTDYVTKVPPVTPVSTPSYSIPEVSKELFDRLAIDNARMKQAIHKIEQQKNIDVQQYMSCLEYERVIAGLREELIHAKYQAEELQQLLNLQHSGRKEPIMAKNYELQQKNTQLTREVVAKKAMADSYREAYDKLKVDIRKVKFTVASDTANQSHDQRSRDSGIQSPTRTTQLPEDVSFPSEEVTRLTSEMSRLTARYDDETNRQQRQIDDLSLQLRQVQDKCDNLGGQCKRYEEIMETQLRTPPRAPDVPESVIHTVEEKRKVEAERDVLRHDLRQALEQKELLVIQLQTFQEDYTKFQNDYQKKQEIIKDQRKKIHDMERNLLTANEKCNSLKAKLSRSEENQRLHSAPVRPEFSQLRSPQASYGRSMKDSGFESSYSSRGSIESRGRSFDSRGSSGFQSLGSRGSSGYGSTESDRMYSTVMSPGGTGFVCERCEEEFKIFEEEQYKEHVKKCVI